MSGERDLHVAFRRAFTGLPVRITVAPSAERPCTVVTVVHDHEPLKVRVVVDDFVLLAPEDDPTAKMAAEARRTFDREMSERGLT